MLARPSRAIALALLILAPLFVFRHGVSAQEDQKYLLPPKAIVDVFDAEPLPQTLINPNHQAVALIKAHNYPTIAELAQPMLRLAGSRVNPKTNGPHRASGLPGTGIYSITMKKTAGGRGQAPTEPAVPTGPTIHESDGKAAPAPTYEDLLKNAHDDALFDYYFTSQLAAINTGTGAKTTIGRPGIFNNVTPSPSGQFVLVNKVKKPFSHLVPMNGFAQDVEIWSRAGELAKKIGDLPSREGTTLTGVEPGPRGYHWRADQPSTILWVEALDGGDLKNKVPFRDKVVSLAPPFSGQPVEVAKTEWRYGGINYTDTGIALLTENDRASRRTRTWIMEPGAAPRKVWDRKQDAAYDNPGSPIARRDGSGGRGGGRGGSGG